MELLLLIFVVVVATCGYLIVMDPGVTLRDKVKSVFHIH